MFLRRLVEILPRFSASVGRRISLQIERYSAYLATITVIICWSDSHGRHHAVTESATVLWGVVASC